MELKEREIRPITIDAGRQHRRYGYRFIKRVFDFVASLLGLIILSPPVSYTHLTLPTN